MQSELKTQKGSDRNESQAPRSTVTLPQARELARGKQGPLVPSCSALAGTSARASVRSLCRPHPGARTRALGPRRSPPREAAEPRSCPRPPPLQPGPAATLSPPGRPCAPSSSSARHWSGGGSRALFTFMPLRRKWQPTPVFLPGESQGRGSLVGCHLWGRTESDTTEVT